MHMSNLWVRSTFLCLAALPALAMAQAARPPVADFFRQPAVQGPVLSPDGKRVALVVFDSDKRGQLAVFDLATPDEAKLLAGIRTLDVTNVRWVNNQRLVYSVRDSAHALANPIAPGLWAIDVDGHGARQLIHVEENEAVGTGTNVRSRILQWNWALQSVLNDGSDDVLVKRYTFDSRDEPMGTGLARLDTRSGQLRSIVKNPPADVEYWWADGKGTPVAAISSSKSSEALLLLQPDGSWKKTFETEAWISSVPVPLALDAAGALWMAGSDVERKTDTVVLLRYDITKPQARPRVVLDLQGYDFDGNLVVERGTSEVLGVNFESDAPGSHWFNAKMKAIQADVDAQLGSTSNTILCERCLEAENLLVVARSDRQPPVFLRYEPATKRIARLLLSRPWIKADQMGAREPSIIKARDGRRLPVMVTFPPGPRKAGRPGVVLVHGGPWIRGTQWEWNADAQFLASRGYVVIEPEFRGSTGYGFGHYEAGFKQWGLAMQDDVSDAMDFAAAQGWIDPKRVCIAGASYGGYATLMGLAKEPERYRCGIEWVGVSDIKLMYDIHWSDFSSAYKKYGMPLLVGDLDKDARQLRDTSPLVQAARINKPLLMAYGGEDRRVPIEHGKAMRDALAAAGNKNVEWVVYGEEGHGWSKLENNVDFWTRVERFLARNIGEVVPH